MRRTYTDARKPSLAARSALPIVAACITNLEPPHRARAATCSPSSAIYKAACSGLLKTSLDLLPPALRWAV
jgi:hypothetical protein